MSIEIKFRALSKDHKHWRYGFFVDRPDGGIILGKFDPAHYEVDKETLGQFTGFQDKNGTDIYDGDKLLEQHIYYDCEDEEDSRIESRYIVAWHPEQGSYYLEIIPKGGTHFEEQDLTATEVTGNIHQSKGIKS